MKSNMHKQTSTVARKTKKNKKEEKRCIAFCGKSRISIFNKTLTNSPSGSAWCARAVLQRLKLHVYSFEEHKLGWSLLAQTVICFLAEYRFEEGENNSFSHCQPCTNRPTVLSEDHHNLSGKACAFALHHNFSATWEEEEALNTSLCLRAWNHLHSEKYHRMPSALIASQWFDGLIQLVKFWNNKPWGRPWSFAIIICRVTVL